MSNEVRTGIENTLAYRTIDFAHWEVHKGGMFFISSVINSFTSNLVEYKMLLVTGTNKEVHWNGYFTANGPCQYRIYENPYVGASSEGTVFANYNCNRNFSTKSSDCIWYESPSTYIVSSLGTPLYAGRIVGTTGNTSGPSVASLGDQARSYNEYIFAPNSKYLFYFKNTAGVAIIAQFESEYYEE